MRSQARQRAERSLYVGRTASDRDRANRSVGVAKPRDRMGAGRRLQGRELQRRIVRDDDKRDLSVRAELANICGKRGGRPDERKAVRREIELTLPRGVLRDVRIDVNKSSCGIG